MIYSGLGILAAVIYATTLFAFWLATLLWTGDPGVFFDHALLTVFSFAVAGAAVWFSGRRLNKLNPLQVLEFFEGERRTVLKPRHTIYTLEMEYWGIVFFSCR